MTVERKPEALLHTTSGQFMTCYFYPTASNGWSEMGEEAEKNLRNTAKKNHVDFAETEVGITVGTDGDYRNYDRLGFISHAKDEGGLFLVECQFVKEARRISTR